MIKSIKTPRGTIVIREAGFADAEKFRELRLFGLQDAPTAFTADHELDARQSMRYWEGRLKPDPNGSSFLQSLKTFSLECRASAGVNPSR